MDFEVQRYAAAEWYFPLNHCTTIMAKLFTIDNILSMDLRLCRECSFQTLEYVCVSQVVP